MLLDCCATQQFQPWLYLIDTQTQKEMAAWLAIRRNLEEFDIKPPTVCHVAQAINEERPPTPPRGRPPNQANSLAFFE